MFFNAKSSVGHLLSTIAADYFSQLERNEKKFGWNGLMARGARTSEIAIHSIFFMLSRVSFMLLALMSQNKLSRWQPIPLRRFSFYFLVSLRRVFFRPASQSKLYSLQRVVVSFLLMYSLSPIYLLTHFYNYRWANFTVYRIMNSFPPVRAHSVRLLSLNRIMCYFNFFGQLWSLFIKRDSFNL